MLLLVKLTLQHLIDLPSTFDVQIDLDVPRTISGQTMFVTRYGAGQRSLFHVLHCFSMHCKTCEYVQGMGPIAATLLCYFDPEVSILELSELPSDQTCSLNPARIHPASTATRRLRHALNLCTGISRTARGVLRTRAVNGVSHA